jgi:hypothetical protein
MRASVNNSMTIKAHWYRLARSVMSAGAAMGLLIIVTMACSCSQRDTVAGKYEAVSQTSEGRIIHALELQADGKGFWSVDTDNVPFRWDLKDNTIRLHTQAGGVLQGTMDRGSLGITLPGQGNIKFTKIR